MAFVRQEETELYEGLELLVSFIDGNYAQMPCNACFPSLPFLFNLSNFLTGLCTTPSTRGAVSPASPQSDGQCPRPSGQNMYRRGAGFSDRQKSSSIKAPVEGLQRVPTVQ